MCIDCKKKKSLSVVKSRLPQRKDKKNTDGEFASSTL